MKSLALITIILISLDANAADGNYVGLSLARLQSKIINGAYFDPIVIENIIGIMIDETGDIILFGRRGQISCLSIDDIIISFRIALESRHSMGVLMYKEYLPNATGMRLIYSGDVDNTGVGHCLADCLSVFHKLANGEEPEIESFGDKRVKLKLTPQEDGCRSGPFGKSIYLLDGPGFTIKIKDSESKGKINKKTDQWVNQILTKSEELEAKYPPLRKLSNLYRLSILFAKIKNKVDTSKWNLLLNHYKIYTTIPRFKLKFDDTSVVVEEITFKQGGLECDEVKDASIAFTTIGNKISKKKDTILFDFDSIGADEFFKDAHYCFFQKLKKTNLNDNCIFMNLNTQKNPPVLESAVEDQVIENQPAAPAFQKLVNSIANDIDDLDTPWNHFYKELRSGNKISYKEKKQMVICSEKIQPSWINFYYINTLKDWFEIYLVPMKKDEDFITSAEAFVSSFEEIPFINRANIGFILSNIDDAQLDLIRELEAIVGSENMLINPTSSRFLQFLGNRSLDTLFIDIGFNNNEIVMRDGTLNHIDILNLDRMDHIKYLAFGLFQNMPNRSWNWDIFRIIDMKGVGLISFTRPSEEKKVMNARLSEIIKLLGDKENNYEKVSSINQMLPSSGQTVFWREIPPDR